MFNLLEGGYKIVDAISMHVILSYTQKNEGMYNVYKALEGLNCHVDLIQTTLLKNTVFKIGDIKVLSRSHTLPSVT